MRGAPVASFSLLNPRIQPHQVSLVIKKNNTFADMPEKNFSFHSICTGVFGLLLELISQMYVLLRGLGTLKNIGFSSIRL